MVDVDTISKMVEGLANWVPMIESELDIMNSGKMGRPFEYCNSMIIWMMVISGYLDTTVRKISGLSNAIFSIIGIKGPSYNRFFERAMAIVGAVDDWLPGQ
ncbi:MAG: hypothetical protein J5945_05950 [Candidatus Methanomethylophilus sp.]|nr:hypothetical protein [Methanomethylophilus sp.]